MEATEINASEKAANSAAKRAANRAERIAAKANPVVSRDRAVRAASLWEKPVLSDSEIPEAVGLAFSSWQVLKRKGDCPKLFRIGRRVFARTVDVRAWIESKASESKAA